MGHETRPLSNVRRLPAVLLAGGLGLALLAGCSSFSPDEKPLPDSTFTKILTELHLQTARHAREMPTPRGLRDSIFARYDVRSPAFDETLRYYSRHPQAFAALYDTIIDTLKALQRKSGRRPLPDSLSDQHRGRDDP